ncbi:MAG: hypothetical protein QXW34_01005 [Candidatus Methanomethyliaceae archaeon]
MEVSSLKLIMITIIISIIGITSIIGAFLYYHPYFNPLTKPQLPKGWIDERTYVSNNFTIKTGETIKDIFQYTGKSGQSILILGVQPLSIEKKGSISITFNNIPLGETYIETTLVVNTSIASCCFVTLIQAGTDNIMEITSNEFEGKIRYLIILPTGR